MGDILSSAGSIADVLAKIEAGRATGRQAQGDAQQRQALAEANIYRTQADVALKGPLQSAKAAAQGDQMANIQPFSWTGGTSMSGNLPIPQSTGGLSPANFGPATRKAGADLATLSANRVSSPDFNIPKPPVLPPLPESNGLDSILSTASGLGSLAGALGKAASGGGGDLGKAAAAIKNLFSHGGSTNGNTGQLTGDFPDNLNDPSTGGGYGPDAPTPSVSTDTQFNGVPGGYPNNPEDPMSADPEWWRQFMGDNGGGDVGSPDDWTDPSLWGG